MVGGASAIFGVGVVQSSGILETGTVAGDWIKMRVWLRRDPRVISMADFLSRERRFMDWLTDPVRKTCNESAYEHVTRNVTVALCVTSLLEIWGTAREQGRREDDDLVVDSCSAETLESVCDVPCIGHAMRSVGWLIEQENGSCVFPKFFADKESPHDKHRSNGAERQARYRNKKRNKSDVTSNVTGDVTGDVTVTPREEKRREENTHTEEGGVCAGWEEIFSILEAKGIIDASECVSHLSSLNANPSDVRAVAKDWQSRNARAGPPLLRRFLLDLTQPKIERALKRIKPP